MKNINTIKEETKNLQEKTTIYSKKEFQELPNIIEDDENILDIINCSIMKPMIKSGILVLTNRRVVFVYDGSNKSLFDLTLISKLDFKKGIMFANLFLNYDNVQFEFDYILNKHIANFIEKIKLAKNNYIPKQIAHTENLTTELSSLEKLQFKKFISDNSGLDIKEVDNYISNLTEDELNELIIEFKKERYAVSVQVDKPPIQQNIQIVQETASTEHMPTCPKCGSKQVAYNKKGFSFGKAAVGGILTGGIGLLAGGIGKNKIVLTCLKCGKHWSK